jgi:hypothetical protein
MEKANLFAQKDAICGGLTSDIAAFHGENKRLPLNWEEFDTWSKKTPTATHWSADYLNPRFALKWGAHVSPSDSRDEKIFIVLDSKFKDIEPFVNGRIHDLCSVPAKWTPQANQRQPGQRVADDASEQREPIDECDSGQRHKWFNQADVMPKKAKRQLNGLKTNPGSGWLPSLRQPVARVSYSLCEWRSWYSRPHLSGLLSLIHPNVSTQGPSSSKRLSSATSKVLGVFHHESPANRVKKRDCSRLWSNFMRRMVFPSITYNGLGQATQLTDANGNVMLDQDLRDRGFTKIASCISSQHNFRIFQLKWIGQFAPGFCKSQDISDKH